MKKFIKTSLCFLLLVAVTASASFLFNVNAAETETLYIDVNYQQTDARGMLSDINAFRTDSTGGAWYWNSDDTTKTEFNTSGNTVLTELKYDYELEKVAMQRAAEISVSFSHTRPDGSTCFTAFPSDYDTWGENIAAGYASASAAFIGWQENDDPYSGQGHRRNMLSSDYNAIGIGHAYVNGTHYWVQEFGYTSNTTTATVATDATLCTEITADSSKLTFKSADLNGFSDYYAIPEGDKIAAPDVIFSYGFEDHWPSNTDILSKPPVQWTSSDSSIAYIENNMIIGKSAGEAILKPTGTSLSINVTVAPGLEITQQPTDTYAKLGETAKINVGASGQELTYTWYFKNPGASTFTKSGIKSSTYSMTMQKSLSGRQVYCVVSDAYGNSKQTDTVTLRLAAAITKQPADTSAAIGEKAKISITAAGDGLTYAWYFKNPGASAFTKSGMTSSAYSMTMQKSLSGRQVYCVVTDKYGNTAKSNTVTLSAESSIAITTQPKTTYAKLGASGKVTVAASGEGLTYTWYFKNPGAADFTKSGIKSSTYSMTMQKSLSGRQVYCVVTDKNGSTVKSNTVYLYLSATITKQPVNTSASIGTKAKISVTAAGEGLTYTWYFKNPGASDFTKSGITSSAYSMTMQKSLSGRQVYCVVTDKYGKTAKSNTVTLSAAIPSDGFGSEAEM